MLYSDLANRGAARWAETRKSREGVGAAAAVAAAAAAANARISPSLRE